MESVIKVLKIVKKCHAKIQDVSMWLIQVSRGLCVGAKSKMIIGSKAVAFTKNHLIPINIYNIEKIGYFCLSK